VLALPANDTYHLFSRRGTGSKPNEPGIQAGLSTQILIICDNVAVGAVQRLTPAESRRLQRINEIGTDGWLEIVPVQPTEVTLTITRVVYDKLRLPESFARGFQHIQSQRYPFNIVILEREGWEYSAGEGLDRITTYENCWFSRYSSPISTDNYLIMEEGEVWSERAFNSESNKSFDQRAEHTFYTDAIEQDVDTGAKPGALDQDDLDRGRPWLNL